MNKKKERELEQIMKDVIKEKEFMDSAGGVVSESLTLANWIISMADSVSCLSRTNFQQLENRILAEVKLTEYVNLLRKINATLRPMIGSGLDTSLKKNTRRKLS